MNLLNQALLKFYKENLLHLNVSSETSKNLSVPLLVQASDTYEQNPEKRTFIIGQETYGWGGGNIGFDFMSYQKDNIREERMMECYQDFIVNAYGKKKHGVSPFWRAFRELASETKDECLFETNLLWTNLLAMDYDGKSMLRMKNISDREKVIAYSKKKILSEIEILKPKVCILFTGPHYDPIIKEIFGIAPGEGETISTKYPIRHLKKFTWNNIQFFRTYHPGYLNRGHWEIMDIVKKFLLP